MYQKRSAWILTGAAPNRGESTSLEDIQIAVQTELPLVKQHLSDILWAIRGQGANGRRFNRLTKRLPACSTTFKSNNLNHGFSSLTRFFPGREILAAIDDEICLALSVPENAAKRNRLKISIFQPAANSMNSSWAMIGFKPICGLSAFRFKRSRSGAWLCCHPYDVCTELIAREAGIFISDENGLPLRSELNLTEEVSWIGYANAAIRQTIEPLLRKAMESTNSASYFTMNGMTIPASAFPSSVTDIGLRECDMVTSYFPRGVPTRRFLPFALVIRLPILFLWHSSSRRDCSMDYSSGPNSSPQAHWWYRTNRQIPCPVSDSG